MEYYSATKRNELESFVVIWMSLELVIQIEVYINIEFRCSSWILKRQINQRPIKDQHHLEHRKSKRISEKKKIYFCFIDYDNSFDCVDHNKLWKVLKEIGTMSPEKPACWSRSNN